MKEVSKRKLWIRTATSFLLAFLFFGAVSYGVHFVHVQTRESVKTPSLFRSEFLFNEKIWAKGHSNHRLNVKMPTPPSSREPRVNGDLGLTSPLDLKNYRIEVESGDQNLELPVSAIQALPKVGYSTEFRCIEGWSEPIQYAGAQFSVFMDAYHIGKKPDGSYYEYVGLETPDGEYYVSIDIESMLHPQTVLAYEMNEHALSVDNGAPIRLIIPVKYGIKHIKRIGRIFFSDERPPDYWAEEGYDWWSGL